MYQEWIKSNVHIPSFISVCHTVPSSVFKWCQEKLLYPGCLNQKYKYFHISGSHIDRFVAWSCLGFVFLIWTWYIFCFALLIMSCILCPDSERSRARSKPYPGLVVLATSARRRWLSHQCCFPKLCADMKDAGRWCPNLKIFPSQRLTEDVGLYGQAKPVPPAAHELPD